MVLDHTCDLSVHMHCIHFACINPPVFSLSLQQPKDSMARRDDVDDYVVVDPLAKSGKGFNRQDAKAKKRGTEWAGGAIA